MSAFLGGSAFAMAQQIAGGYVLVTERHIRKLASGELNQLDFELDRVQRELRGSQAATDEVNTVRERNRKLQRLSSCRLMIQNLRQRIR